MHNSPSIPTLMIMPYLALLGRPPKRGNNYNKLIDQG
jgi:hypothetical protein